MTTHIYTMGWWWWAGCGTGMADGADVTRATNTDLPKTVSHCAKHYHK